MNHLLRGHAPLTDSNWKLLDEEARERLAGPLAARRLVDFVGPQGWEHSATNLGRVEPVEAPGDGIAALRRRLQQLVQLGLAWNFRATPPIAIALAVVAAVVLAVQLLGAVVAFGFALRPDRNPPPAPAPSSREALTDEPIPEPVA